MNLELKRRRTTEESRTNNLLESLESFNISFEELKSQSKKYCNNLVSFACGSLVEGLGNITSDIDIYAINDDNTNDRVIITNLNEIRVDYEFCSLSEIEYTNSLLSSALDLAQQLPPIRFKSAYRFHRIIESVSISNSDKLNTIKSNLNINAFYVYVCRLHLYTTESRLQDAIGALLSEKLDYAMSRARNALDAAVDLYLAFQGDTNVRTKHRLLKLPIWTNSHEILFDHYRHFQSYWPIDPVAKRKFIEKILSFSQELKFQVSEQLDQLPETYHSEGD